MNHSLAYVPNISHLDPCMKTLVKYKCITVDVPLLKGQEVGGG
uniref:Uncharacterized protein n=1 Tax=Anguilla anguilla TaxID=7936 RepID=A0A0E9RHL8_ANGAN